MGVKIKREKERVLLASLLYRLIKLPLSDRAKFKLFLNIEWMFDRLIHELSHKIYDQENHPLKKQALKFILDCIKPEDMVLDLGCSTG